MYTMRSFSLPSELIVIIHPTLKIVWWAAQDGTEDLLKKLGLTTITKSISGRVLQLNMPF